MNRWHWSWALLALLLTWALHTQAQVAPVRDFPEAALRGRLVMGSPPDLNMDGRPLRLGAGARIWGTDNMLVLSASLYGQTWTVNYRQDASGLITEMWLLRAAEIKLPRAAASSANNLVSEFPSFTGPAIGSRYKQP